MYRSKHQRIMDIHNHNRKIIIWKQRLAFILACAVVMGLTYLAGI